MSNFETTERIIAVAPEAVATLFPQLLAQYGQELPDGTRIVLTIGGHWDDAEKARIRAASLTDGTITPQPLTDGRVAFRCLWQADLAAAFDAGEIEGVEELDDAELAALTPQPEAPTEP
jgi:DNA-binding transcriptional LysR family regulator